jgi:hypothetical protein
MGGTRRKAILIVGTLCATGLLAGAAVAANPHGTAPGQAKKTQSTSSSKGKAKGHAHAPGQLKKSSGSSAGVKPSNTTQKNTHAQAGSNQTKLYGNGKTAGQIAQQNGADPSTDLYGPGNSQPHKVAVCSKNGKTHYVDVHALKAHSASKCSDTSAGDTKRVNGDTPRAVTVSASPLAKFSGVLAAAVRLSGVLAARTGLGLAPRHSGVLGLAPRHSGVLGARHSVSSKPVAGQAKAAHAVTRRASFTG